MSALTGAVFFSASCALEYCNVEGNKSRCDDWGALDELLVNTVLVARRIIRGRQRDEFAMKEVAQWVLCLLPPDFFDVTLEVVHYFVEIWLQHALGERGDGNLHVDMGILFDAMSASGPEFVVELDGSNVGWTRHAQAEADGGRRGGNVVLNLLGKIIPF